LFSNNGGAIGVNGWQGYSNHQSWDHVFLWYDPAPWHNVGLCIHLNAVDPWEMSDIVLA